jgi:Rad3-related DNA helicase
LLVIDECHEIEDITRDFARFSVLLKKEALEVCREPGAGNRSPDKWFQELSRFAELYSDLLVNEVPGTDPKEYTSDREEYLVKLQNMAEKVERMWSESSKEYIHYVVEEGPDIKDTQIRLHFVPIRVRNITQNLLLDYGSQRLLMSGTIYSKKIFSSTVGLKEEETYFIKIGSSFHKANRKILLRRNLALDLSHKAWEDNFQEMIENLQKILDTFGDVKGLIHTPSYWASHQIYNALSRKVGGRLIEHDKDNFHESLAKHYSIPNSSVFVSPICQQGVDFKGDRARFQVILRVPYPNVSDPFTMYMMRNNYQWYNYQALVVFGQQIGRIVRSEEDWGTTILMDSRFEGFINKNRTLLPKWVMESVEIR